VYSRISSHILGDWNACGKVMGLAAWAQRKQSEAAHCYFGESEGLEKLELGQNFYHKYHFMSGNPFDGSFNVDWDSIESLEHANDLSDARFGYYANIAASVQADLQACTMSMLQSLQSATRECKLVLTGGVALNSVLNGLVKSSKLFDELYIPPAPGDEGIAIGCAMYGLQRHKEQEAREAKQQAKMFDFPRDRVNKLLAIDSNGTGSPLTPPQLAEAPSNVDRSAEEMVKVAFQQASESPYQGSAPTSEAVDQALWDFDPYIFVTKLDSAEELVEDAALELAEGKVVAWFQGRSELGQRALGGRSVLADPRRAELRRKMNALVKHREWFRPLAPSVLDEHVSEWFEGLVSGANASPYMSLTARLRRSKLVAVPAVAHVDGTARLQTVTEASNALYHRLIRAFYKKTGVPMVLNTSFNGKNQPIIETPAKAIKALLQARSSIDALYLGAHKIRLRAFPLAEGSEEEPSEVDGKQLVRAQLVYMSEIVSSLPASNGDTGGAGLGSVLRVRIQDALSVGSDELIEEGEHDSAGWRALPSDLHLDILQLLQAPPSAGGGAAGDLSVAELWEGLQQLRGVHHLDGDEERGEEEVAAAPGMTGQSVEELEGVLTWPQVRQALHWLYFNALVSFVDLSEEAEASELFKDVEVVDLRAFTQ
jgi:predicted NodU family carbamoyl transferase